jgi:1-acyl-sn-glycerol-3-phosphate acyltransferase
MAAPRVHPLRHAGRAAALAAVLLDGCARYLLHPGHRRDAAGRARWLQGICQRLLGVLHVRVTVTGSNPGGGVVATNHLSYVDILVLGAQAPTVFVAKSEVRGWPVFGWFARAAGTVFVQRERRGDVARAGDAMAPLLGGGVNLVLFPEGTSSDGRTVGPFRSSLLEPAVRHHRTVVAAALGYAVPPRRSAADEVCYWRDMTLAPHLWNLLSLPWVEARLAWGEPRPAGPDRKLLAQALHTEVVRLHQRLGPDQGQAGVAGAAAGSMTAA